MSFWKRIFGGNTRHFNVFTEERGGVTDFDLTTSYAKRLDLALKNPALLKVISLQCDMFSLGEFVIYKDGEEVEDHKLKKLLDDPNPFQSREQFLWEFMFWQMLGVSYVYVDTDDLDRLLPNKMYLLKPYSVEYPRGFKENSDKMILSSSGLKSYLDTKINYRYNDGKAVPIELRQLEVFSDLGTPISRTDFQSRIDALLKVIYNNEASLDAMNINTRYSGKFLVAGTQNPNDVTRLPLGEEEKEDIEYKMLNDEPVKAVKSMIEIKRFVENAGNQKLDEAYLHTYFVIGSMYNIPKDVLEAFNSGTYENQEKARGAHVAYTLQPKGNSLCGKLAKRFKLAEEGVELFISWEGQPFMQVFAEQRARAKKTIAETIGIMQKAGIAEDDINRFLDVNFEYNGRPKQAGDGGETEDEETGQERN